MRWIPACAALFCSTAIISPLALAAAQNAALQQVVDGFYPVDRLKPADTSERYSCFQVLGSTPANEPSVIIAGYTDRANGAVRVLRRNASGAFDVAYDNPESWTLPGTRCALRLHDMDFDGQPEALVNFLGVRASAGWLLKWNGSTLSSLTPIQSDGGRQSSRLLSPTVYDLAHNGTLRVIAAGGIDRLAPGERPVNPAFVYRLGADGLEVEKSILAVMGFRADVAPEGNLRPFRLVQDSFPPYTLRVINGDRLGQHRVTGATLRINNVEILGPDQVNEKTEFTTIVLSDLFTENHLTATLTGPPDATILVLVEDSTKR
jgi:hypothetical protein